MPTLLLGLLAFALGTFLLLRCVPLARTCALRHTEEDRDNFRLYLYANLFPILVTGAWAVLFGIGLIVEALFQVDIRDIIQAETPPPQKISL